MIKYDYIPNIRLGKWNFKDPITGDIVKYPKGKRQEVKQMATLRESAEEYTPMVTLNVADLKEVSTEIDINNKVVNEGTKDQFSYNFIVVDGQEYRVPKTVLKQLKAQLEEKPDSTLFKVKKSGEGLNTEYNVIMLD